MRKLYAGEIGFSLIELLVVIGVIGVLASVIFVVLDPQLHSQQARDGKRKADLLQISAALEQYRGDQGNYSIVPNSQNPTLVPCGTPLTDPNGNISYIKAFPCDPLGVSQQYNGGNYSYEASTGMTYYLVACLDNANDPEGTPKSQLLPIIPSNNCQSNLFYVIHGNGN